jgi:putative addiction module component (TIGR02574 family)
MPRSRTGFRYADAYASLLHSQ